MTDKVFLGGVDDGRMTITEWLKSAIANPDVLHVYQQEGEFDWGWDVRDPDLQPLIHEAKKNNNLRFVFGTENNSHPGDADPLTINQRDNISNFVFSMAGHISYHQSDSRNFSDRSKHPRTTGKWKGNYVSLMNKPRDHRVSIFKSIIKYDPDLTKGFVTWATQPDCWRQHTELCQTQYPDLAAKISHLEHKLRPQGHGGNFNWGIIPQDYHHYWLDIVAETTNQYTFYTEKTWRPIACGKPFIILGYPNQNIYLSNYGFKLFPEIFDYQVEDIPPEDERYHISYQKMIHRVINLSHDDILELDALFQYRYKWNYDLLEYIIMSDDEMPEICREEVLCGNDFFTNRCGDIPANREVIKNHRSRIDFTRGIYL